MKTPVTTTDPNLYGIRTVENDHDFHSVFCFQEASTTDKQEKATFMIHVEHQKQENIYDLALNLRK